MKTINELANAIYLPRVDGRTRIIRRVFEQYRAGILEDPRPEPIKVLFCGILFGFVVCVPIIVYLIFGGK